MSIKLVEPCKYLYVKGQNAVRKNALTMYEKINVYVTLVSMYRSSHKYERGEIRIFPFMNINYDKEVRADTCLFNSSGLYMD